MTNGSHPFGKKYQRQGNITEYNPVNFTLLSGKPFHDIIRDMISHEPEQRPSAQEIKIFEYLATDLKHAKEVCTNENVVAKLAEFPKNIHTTPTAERLGMNSKPDEPVITDKTKLETEKSEIVNATERKHKSVRVFLSGRNQYTKYTSAITEVLEFIGSSTNEVLVLETFDRMISEERICDTIDSKLVAMNFSMIENK